MACHMRLASENAKFGQPEVNLGVIPGYGGTQRMSRLIGKGRTLELLLTGTMITAERAYETGLVNQVFPAAELEAAGRKMLNTIFTKAPLAISYVLETVNRGLNLSLEEGIRLEADYFGQSCASQDMKEGTSAFLEKRKPEFKGN
jgi:enoyl-CoA hydratase